MRRVIQFSIFFTIFFIFSLIMHYYIFFHMSYMLSVHRDIWFWSFFIISSLSFILALFLEFTVNNQITRIFFIISAVWFGALFILIFMLINYDIIRNIITLEPYVAGRMIIGVLTIFITYGLINAYLMRTREVIISAKGHGKGNLRIVHLSDLHIGSVRGPRYLQKAVEKTNELNPDLVFITGDLADGPYGYTPKSFSALNEIKAPVFFTTGNHEFYAGLDEVLELFSKTKLRILRNEKVNVGNVQIVGIDDGVGKNNIGPILKSLNLDPKKYTILLHHRPIALEDANKYGVNLMLAGHTHGGQFFPFIMFARLIWRRAKGLYKYKNTYLNTSTGIGTWGPPLRLGTNSEIVLI
ncbi:MAG: metallophosphoesterase, partial [Thermoplasmata archaeon]|nr:metallophosphoesterase [Thermoplasmata archaeon]